MSKVCTCMELPCACLQARQTRTIRRLRALADGYLERAKMWRFFVQCTGENIRAWMLKDREFGRKEERARIVAKIRRDAERPEVQGRNPDGVFYLLADAIERGEL